MIENLSYAYLSNWLFRRVPVLSEIALDVKEGECFGFLGHNGAGKTTTIKCILDLIKPQTGHIYVCDYSHNTMKAKNSVGFLAEQPYFYDHLSVFEFMCMCAGLSHIPRSETKRRIYSVLEKTGVRHKTEAPLRSLSKGLLQRVAMAQAIIADPKLLILDEPFSGLDPMGRKDFRELILELNSEGTTVFMSSHILSDIEYLCGRAAMLVQGRLMGIYEIGNLPVSQERYEIVAENKEELVEQVKSLSSSCTFHESFFTAQFDSRETAHTALRLVLDSNARIEDFSLKRQSLEEIFLKQIAAATEEVKTS